MALSLREGKYGYYWGNDYNSSNALSTNQMQINARYIYDYLSNEGWTLNAIAGMLGNLQAESSINPGRWQSDRVGGEAEGHGYGLVQWTPYTKYITWCDSMGYSDPSKIDNNLSRIVYEVKNNIQWIGRGSWSNMSFYDFTRSNLTPEELGASFVICYERPADQSSEVQSYRGSLARSWYDYLTGVIPNPPVTKSKKNSFNYLLFRRRKRIYGQR